MKKFTAILIAVILMLSVCTLTVFASETDTAAEPETVEQEDVTAVEVGGNVMTLSAFFTDTVLPFLVSTGSLLVGLIAVAGPIISKSGKFNRLQGHYNEAMEQLKTYADALKSLDIDKYKYILDGFVSDTTEYISKELARLGLDNSAVADMTAKIALLNAQVDALMRGAQNAWAQAPGAVACLTEAPTESIVRKQAAEIVALQGYIKAQKGEEAQAIIDGLKEEV